MSPCTPASLQPDDMVIEVTSHPAALAMASAAIAMDRPADLRAVLEAHGLVAAQPCGTRRLRREHNKPAERRAGLSPMRPGLEPTRKAEGSPGPCPLPGCGEAASAPATPCARCMADLTASGYIRPIAVACSLGNDGLATLITMAGAVATDEPEDQLEGADSVTHHH